MARVLNSQRFKVSVERIVIVSDSTSSCLNLNRDGSTLLNNDMQWTVLCVSLVRPHFSAFCSAYWLYHQRCPA
jgi:hypothetical protein